MFHKLVIPQILETLGFYLVAVVMASRGYGIVSFTVAVFVRGLVGTVAMFIVSPWKIRIGISKEVVKRLMKFGVPFQLNSVLALLKDDLVTMVLGKVLPFEAIGYIGWAKKWAELPLRLIMDSVIRVTFPAYARLQHDRQMLGKAISTSIFAIAGTIIPISVGLLFFVSPMVDMIPRYGKWVPAIAAFYLFTVSSAIAAFSTPLTNMLNAIGRIKVTLTLMVLWTVMTWVCTFSLIPLIGFMAVPVTALILSLTVFWVVHLVKKEVDMRILGELKNPVIAAAAQAIAYAGLLPFLRHSWIGLIVSGIIGLVVYTGILWFQSGSRIIEVARMGKKT
jgi:O-antigen/teichoic acid export membrane protein